MRRDAPIYNRSLSSPIIRTTDLVSNVAYIELDIPKDKFKPEMLELLPNTEYSTSDVKRLCGQKVSKMCFCDFL